MNAPLDRLDINMHKHITAKSATLWIACCTAALALQGCTTSRPVELWQERVTQYVTDEGNGDITSLRNTNPGATRPVFGVTSGSVDVHGLLLGCTTVNSQQWWTYVVGVMKSDDLTDLRLVSVCEVNGGLTYCQSTENEAAVQRYRDSRFDQWKNNRLDPSASEGFLCSFPGRNDAFTFDEAGNTASVTERQSSTRLVIMLVPDGEQSESRVAANSSTVR